MSPARAAAIATSEPRERRRATCLLAANCAPCTFVLLQCRRGGGGDGDGGSGGGDSNDDAR